MTSFLDRILAPLGYSKAPAVPPPAPAPAPEVLLDVAMTMVDNPSAKVSLISCVMTESEYRRLAGQWAMAVSRRGDYLLADSYDVTINGQRINHGIILSDIASLTGVYLAQGEK